MTHSFALPRIAPLTALLLVAALLWAGGAGSRASTPRPTATPALPTTAVACVGDSITFGQGISNPSQNSYPAVLGRSLGNSYHVGNFGVSGSTVINSGDLPYQAQSAYLKALKFNPHIVVILLGTNDSRYPFTPQKSTDFEADYKSLIASFRRVNTAARIYTCLPIPSYTKKRQENTTLTKSILPIIRKVAQDAHTTLIDLNTPFTNRQDLYRDAYHPTNEGAKYLASIVAKALQNTR